MKDLPLTTRQKAFFFIFNCGLGIVPIIIADTKFRGQGYERRFKDSFKWMLYGFLTYLAIGLAIQLIINFL